MATQRLGSAACLLVACGRWWPVASGRSAPPGLALGRQAATGPGADLVGVVLGLADDPGDVDGDQLPVPLEDAAVDQHGVDVGGGDRPDNGRLQVPDRGDVETAAVDQDEVGPLAGGERAADGLQAEGAGTVDGGQLDAAAEAEWGQPLGVGALPGDGHVPG